MNLLQWFTRNWADTDEGSDPALVPLSLPVPPDQALDMVRLTIQNLPRWQIERIDTEAKTVHATRRTPLFRFVDDIHLRLEESPTGTRVHARSQSRIGKADFGQNRRNILALFNAIAQRQVGS